MTSRWSHVDDMPYLPATYDQELEIPFTTDGNSPYLAHGVEKAIGTHGVFAGLSCVRKMLVIHSSWDDRVRRHFKRQFLQEAKILHLAMHCHVVAVFYTYFDKTGRDDAKFAIIMDRADTNLHHLLLRKESPRLMWFGCLIGAVRHIHGLGIRHRDIKPDNILIQGEQVLLSDFGISQMGLGKTMPTTDERRKRANSPEYCAPEVDRGQTRGRSADIFSLGAVFLEMIIGHQYPNLQGALRAVLQPDPNKVSSYAKSIEGVHRWIETQIKPHGWWRDILQECRSMLDPNRERRPTAMEVACTLSDMFVWNDTVRCGCVANENPTQPEKLIEACKFGSLEDVKDLLSQGANPNTPGAMHFAADTGSVAIVQTLLNAGALVNGRNPVGQTALHCACRNGFADIVKLLLDKGANVNVKDENNQTPLQGAAGQGAMTIVKWLLDRNADVHAADLDANTAVDFAARRHHHSVVKLLDDFQM